MKKLILLSSIIACCLSANAQSDKSANSPSPTSVSSKPFAITDLTGPSTVSGGAFYTYTLPNLPSGYPVKWVLTGPGYVDSGEFVVDDSSASVYLNSMPSNTPNGTATLTAYIQIPGSTNPHNTLVAEMEITITYCTVCP